MNLNQECILPMLVTAIAVYLILQNNRQEGFSSSGMNMSNRYCGFLTDGFYRPRVTNPVKRRNYRRRLCSPLRRNVVDHGTGNYYMIGQYYI